MLSHFFFFFKEHSNPSIPARVPGRGDRVDIYVRTSICQPPPLPVKWFIAATGVWGFFAEFEMVYFCAFLGRFSLLLINSNGGSVAKNLPANAGDKGLIPESGRSPREGNTNPLQHFCLECPWTEEPGKLYSMRLQRVRYNLVTKQQQQ